MYGLTGPVLDSSSTELSLRELITPPGQNASPLQGTQLRSIRYSPKFQAICGPKQMKLGFTLKDTMQYNNLHHREVNQAESYG